VEILNKYDKKKVSEQEEFLDKIVGKKDKKYFKTHLLQIPIYIKRA